MIPTHFQEVESLYRRILQSGQHVFAICAPAMGQGASTLGYAAARRCSRAGKRVLLVEMYTHGSRLYETMAIARDSWLPTVESARQATTTVDNDRLGLLAAPLHDHLPLGFREPDTLTGLVDAWRRQYDFVFLVTAPMSMVNRREISPIAVIRTCDVSLLSVMPRKTTHQELENAVAMIEQSGTPLLATIVNDRHNPLIAEEIKRKIRQWLPACRLRLAIERKIDSLPLLQQLP
jgi:Mrp family chromosome partitioning ATPase